MQMQLSSILAVATFACGISGCAANEAIDESTAEGLDTGSEQAPVRNSSQTMEDLVKQLAPPPAVPGERGRDVHQEQLYTYGYGVQSILPYQGSFTGTASNTNNNQPNSGVIYAILVHSGSWIDSIAYAYYIPSNPDNRYRAGDFYGTYGSYGGAGGGTTGWDYCPTGAGAAIGLRGSVSGYGSADHVYGISLICNDVAATGFGSVNWTPMRGTLGNYSFYEYCTSNIALLGFIGVRYGAYVNGLDPVCIYK